MIMIFLYRVVILYEHQGISVLLMFFSILAIYITHLNLKVKAK